MLKLWGSSTVALILRSGKCRRMKKLNLREALFEVWKNSLVIMKFPKYPWVNINDLTISLNSVLKPAAIIFLSLFPQYFFIIPNYKRPKFKKKIHTNKTTSWTFSLSLISPHSRYKCLYDLYLVASLSFSKHNISSSTHTFSFPTPREKGFPSEEGKNKQSFCVSSYCNKISGCRWCIRRKCWITFRWKFM